MNLLTSVCVYSATVVYAIGVPRYASYAGDLENCSLQRELVYPIELQTVQTV